MNDSLSTSTVRPISRVLAVELTDDELDKVAGGACKLYTRCCTHTRDGEEDPGCKSTCDDDMGSTSQGFGGGS